MANSTSSSGSNTVRFTPYNIRRMKKSSGTTIRPDPIIEPKLSNELATFNAEFQEWLARRQIRRDLIRIVRDTLIKQEFKESWPMSLEWNIKSGEPGQKDIIVTTPDPLNYAALPSMSTDEMWLRHEDLRASLVGLAHNWNLELVFTQRPN